LLRRGLKQGAGAQELAYMEDGSGEPKMGGPGFNNNAPGFDNNGHGHGPALASGFNKGDNPHAPAIAPVTNY
jgi:hypothetical protein